MNFSFGAFFWERPGLCPTVRMVTTVWVETSKQQTTTVTLDGGLGFHVSYGIDTKGFF